MTEILITLAIGLIAGLAGMLLWWALLSDWWHGGAKKRRCQKCAYDMSGTSGLKCPECGRMAKTERGLHRSRRRWRLGLVALVLLLGASLLPVGVKVYRYGWQSIVSDEQVALVASFRGQWEYSGWGWRGQRPARSGLDRWALAKAVRTYLSVPGALDNEGFAYALGEILNEKNPVISETEVVQLVWQNDALYAGTPNAKPTRAATTPASAKVFIERLGRFADREYGEGISWEEWAAQDAGAAKGTSGRLALNKPLTIPMDRAVDRMLLATDDANELLNIVAALRRAGCEDVLDAYWETCKQMSADTCTNAALALCYDIARAPPTDRQREIAAEALALAPSDARGLRRVSGLVDYLSDNDAEPLIFSLAERCTADEFARAIDPTIFNLPTVRGSNRLFRTIASLRMNLSDPAALDTVLIRMDLAPDEALRLLAEGTVADQSAAAMFMARRRFLANDEVFSPFRQILARIAADESRSIADRTNALVAIHDRTPSENRLSPVRP